MKTAVNPEPQAAPRTAGAESPTLPVASTVEHVPTAAPRVRGVSGLGRAAIVVVGALVVLQSSQDVGPLKIAYLAVAAIVVIASTLEVRRRWHSSLVDWARPWLIVSGVTAALIVLSLPVAIARGTPISAWLRDAAGYGLLVVAPWLAIDLAFSTSRRTALAFTVGAGAAATVSYAVVWIQRRQIAEFPIDRLALPSLILAAALFAVAVAGSLSTRRHQYRWAAAASLTIGLLVFSGTRSSLALLIVCPVVLFASWLSERERPMLPRLRIALMPIVAAIAIVVATQIWTPGGGPLLGTGPTATNGTGGTGGSSGPVGRNLTERYDSIGSVLSGRDPSFQERLSQTRAVWAVFLTSPIVGGGLGVPIEWTDSKGVAHTDNAFTADTPILFLAKFGLFGLALVISLAWATIATIRSLRAGGRVTRSSWLATIGFATAVLVLMPFGWQLEDKGTALAVILVVGFGLIEARDALHPTESSNVGPVGRGASTPPARSSSRAPGQP